MWINQMLQYLLGLNLEDKGYIMDSAQLKWSDLSNKYAPFLFEHLDWNNQLNINSSLASF